MRAPVPAPRQPRPASSLRRRRQTLVRQLRLVIDGDDWHAEVIDGPPDQAPTYSSAELGDGRKRKGKSARCLFCQHPHSLETVKAKGFADEYRDEILAAADTVGESEEGLPRPAP